MGNIATITENHPATYFGMVYKPLTIDLDEHPLLKIKVTDVEQQWGLKLRDTATGQVAALQADTSQKGVLAYDVAAASGWSGTKNVTLQIWVIGEGKTMKADWVKLVVPAEENVRPATAKSNWTAHDVLAEGDGKTLQIKEHSSAYSGMGYISFAVTADLDATPYLGLNIKQSGGSWSVKVNDGTGDIAIQPTIAKNGQVSYNLADITGWSGSKTFELKIFVIGLGKTLTLDWVRLGHLPFPGTDGANMGAVDGLAVITQTDTAYYWGNANMSAVVNVDEYPYIEIDVPRIDTVSSWGLKAFDGTEVKVIQLDNIQVGKLTYNLKELTGWSGNKTLTFQIFAIGSGKSVYAKSLRLLNIKPVIS